MRYSCMLIVIPLCGFGTRFHQGNYNVPKPLILIDSVPLILHIINRVNVVHKHTILCVCPIYFKTFDIEGILKGVAEVVFLYEPTQGALDTCMKGLQIYGHKAETESPLLIMDGDVAYNVDIAGRFQDMFGETSNANAAISVFDDCTTATCYSFSKAHNGIVSDIAEKQRISSVALSGCYGFKSIGVFLRYASEVLMAESLKCNNEFYMSSVVRLLLQKNQIVKEIMLHKNDIMCCGTPDQLFNQLGNMKSSSIGVINRICFDFDGTLVTSPFVQGDYSTVQPIHRNIQYAQFLKSLGHIIIIYTARRMKTHNGNVGAVVMDIARVTLDTIDKYDIPCDEIYFGKPYADFYIDDKAVPAQSQIHKLTGLYNLNKVLEARKFNNILLAGNTVTKSAISENHKHAIDSEIYYYENIPNDVDDLFPNFISKTDASYTIERIDFPTASVMFTSECMSENRLQLIMGSIQRIHSFSDTSANMPSWKNIIQHYACKFEKRIDMFKSSYDIARHINACKRFLQEYSVCTSHRICMIHGDPVFTNILVCNDTVKFIDMNGSIGPTNTIYGDIVYDYAKIFQSLLGYDEILNNTTVSHYYKSKLLAIYWHCIPKEYHRVIKQMTHFLIVTLLPLHEDTHVPQFIYLADELLTSVNSGCTG